MIPQMIRSSLLSGIVSLSAVRFPGICGSATLPEPACDDTTRFALTGEVFSAMFRTAKKSACMASVQGRPAKLLRALGGLKVLSGSLPPCAPLLVGDQIPARQCL